MFGQSKKDPMYNISGKWEEEEENGGEEEEEENNFYTKSIETMYNRVLEKFKSKESYWNPDKSI